MPPISACARSFPTALPRALKSTTRLPGLLPARGWRPWSSSGDGGGGDGSSGGGSNTRLAAAPRGDLLRGVDADNREAVARIVEQAQRAADSWSVAWSDFYTPPVVADALVVLQRMADVGGLPWGGYPQAERCRLALGREEAIEGLSADPSLLDGVAALQCKGNFLFDPATHRDFLGACLGTGIERDKVGDILVTGEQGAQILVAPHLVEHLEGALTQVRTVPVLASVIPLADLQVRAPRVEALSSVEASLRLDAVASAGFRMSRSKMTDLVKSGDVRVNWRSGCKASADVKAGDVISVAGKGRLEIKAAERTAKGKFRVEMQRYL
ncbi:photosystem II S4 domain [Micractinium conductrix]|uniref:Photosystem II S4 domain n=1 Tax=Micractinium conductrix TaxID=554055 RepID=A0A2P6V4F5_9CHLO|nr:photosystem II S4 domain [Micractinium conductrix]|eukprot:PSC68957.1 photosystem II S4 domain [Micractinium conductrix]